MPNKMRDLSNVISQLDAQILEESKPEADANMLEISQKDLIGDA